MSDIPDDDDVYNYNKYSIHSEYSLFVELKENNKTCIGCQRKNYTCFIDENIKCRGCKRWGDDCIHNDEKTSNLSIDGKRWSFTYTPFNQTLGLEMSMHSSDSSKTIAELIFWYFKDEEVAIMKKTVHTFGVDSRRISVFASGIIPANKKFNIIIRFLEERTAENENNNNSLESYYGDYEGVETVTLSIAGTESEETSFVVPKYALMFASHVFRRMFINEIRDRQN